MENPCNSKAFLDMRFPGRREISRAWWWPQFVGTEEETRQFSHEFTYQQDPSCAITPQTVLHTCGQ